MTTKVVLMKSETILVTFPDSNSFHIGLSTSLPLFKNKIPGQQLSSARLLRRKRTEGRLLTQYTGTGRVSLKKPKKSVIRGDVKHYKL